MISATERAVARARHVQQAIANLREVIGDDPLQVVRRDKARWPALQRYLEIISEASRHIPDDWKTSCGPSVEWRSIAGIGNHLRHEYHKADDAVLWDIYENDLDPLEAAIDAMLAAQASNPPRPSSS